MTRLEFELITVVNLAVNWVAYVGVPRQSKQAFLSKIDHYMEYVHALSAAKP